MLTTVKFLLTYVHIVLGRVLIILYILTIILVGFSHGVRGGWDFLTNMHIYMKQETSVVGTVLCLPFCSTKECVRWQFCITVWIICMKKHSAAHVDCSRFYLSISLLGITVVTCIRIIYFQCYTLHGLCAGSQSSRE